MTTFGNQYRHVLILCTQFRHVHVTCTQAKSEQLYPIWLNYAEYDIFIPVRDHIAYTLN